MRSQNSHISNARYVRNLIEKAIREHAVRMLHQGQPSKKDLMTLASQDFVTLTDKGMIR